MKRYGIHMISSLLLLALTACAPQAEVEVLVTALPTAATAAPIMATVEVVLPAAEPTSAPVAATPTPTPVPEWVGIKDNGVDGVGTVRGNTNGNHALTGWTVSDGKVICYFCWTGAADSPYGKYSSWDIRCRDRSTGAETVLFSSESGHVEDDILGPQLNLYRGYLYYCGDAVWRAPLAGGEPKLVLEGDLLYLFVAYGEVYITRHTPGVRGRHDTVVLDADTLQELRVLEGFTLEGAMDGRLYGRLSREHREYVSMDPDGSNIKTYAWHSNPVIPCCGYLYTVTTLDDLFDEFDWDTDSPYGLVSKIDVETEETQVFTVPGFFCAMDLNATEKYLYIQRNVNDECGDIWRMTTDGRFLAQFDSRIYDAGIPLIGDTAALDLVPCAVKSY